jgi:twitching motility protein PilI
MSKRINLREFQQSLIDRLQSADPSEYRHSKLGVIIAGQRWLVDVLDIGAVSPVPTLTEVSFAKAWFRGVASVRGNLYGVVDIAAYLRLGTLSEDSLNRVLLLAERYAFNSAFLVDRVVGLRDTTRWRQNHEDGKHLEYQDEQGAVWYRLDVKALLEQAEFLQIGA